MIQTCTNCKNYDISISDEPCRKCQQAFRRGEGKPNFIASITNADRIRGMTDEEMADWLGVYCNGQTAQEVGKPCVSGMGSCEECWLDWLKQEAVSDG